MPSRTLHGRALQEAAQLLGGESSLGRYLGVSQPRLQLYLEGRALCPADVSQKIARLLLESEHGRGAGSAP